jgi:hypothetical protein
LRDVPEWYSRKNGARCRQRRERPHAIDRLVDVPADSNTSPLGVFAPDRVTMLAMAPAFRPYCALNVELSTVISCTVRIDVCIVRSLNCSLTEMPFTMKFTPSSRFPAVLNP